MAIAKFGEKLMYANAMECPSCKNYMTLKEFCLETNPFKFKCPECEARLRYKNRPEIVKAIVQSSLIIMVCGLGLWFVIPHPYNTILMFWAAVGCCVLGFYKAYTKGVLEEIPESEQRKKAD